MGDGEEKANIEEILSSVEMPQYLIDMVQLQDEYYDEILEEYRGDLRAELKKTLDNTADAQIDRYVNQFIEQRLASAPVAILQSNTRRLNTRIRQRSQIGQGLEGHKLMKYFESQFEQLNRRFNVQEVQAMPRLSWLLLGARTDPRHPLYSILKAIEQVLVWAAAPFKKSVGPYLERLGKRYPRVTGLFKIIWDWGVFNIEKIFNLITAPALAGIKLAEIFLGFVPGMNSDNVQERVAAFVIQLVVFAVAAFVIFLQFRVLQALISYFDWVAGTNYLDEANWLMSEYMLFLKNIFFDSASLLTRMFVYATTGTGPRTPNTWTAGLKSKTPLFFAVKKLIQILKTALSKLPEIFFGEENVKLAQKEWDNWTWIFGWLRKQGKEWKEWSDGIKEAAVEFAYATAEDFMGAVNNIVEKIGDIELDPVKLAKRAFKYLFPDVNIDWMIEGGNVDRTPIGLRPHNVMTVCAILGISKSTFDSLENKQMVKYVNENPLHDGQVFCAVVHAARELKQRQFKSLRF